MRDDTKVALAIVAAGILIFLCAWWGDFRGYASHPGPDPLFPSADRTILDNAEFIIAPYTIAFIVFFVLAVKAKRSIIRKISNTLLFILLVGAAFFWTEHTGGLSRGLYGAGYLSLFSVAWIVPSRLWVRLATATTVALGAIILANAGKDLPRERFYCFCCLLGTASAALIRWVLEEHNDSQPRS
jgi:hypothetical protein